MALRPIPRPKVPRVGRPTGRFTQHRRLDRLRETLESHPGGLALDDLAALLHVTTRSVRRYLRELALVTEVESIETTPGGAHLWRVKPSERGRAVAFRRTQAYGLLAARRAFDLMRGSALFDEVDIALRQVQKVAERPIKSGMRGEIPSDQRLEQRFVYVPFAARSYAGKSEALDDLFQAVAELRVLRFRYGRPGERPRPVIAHPYAMLLYRGDVVFVARDTSDGKLRPFFLERVTDTSPSESERFTLPLDFDANEWIQGEFGVGRPERRVRVLIEFEARAAEAVRARRVHPTQKIATAPDGRVRVSLSVGDLAAVKAWILGFGSAARVIEPASFAEEVTGELRQALSRYDG